MTKIFKQLARHWAVCLVVFALLFVQAYCDLSLPDYTSKIVDTGIQQGGIESPLPDTVRQSTLDALSLLMREEDAAAFQNAYTADGDVLRLRTDLTADERTALEDAVTTPDIVLYLAATQAANTPAGQTGMGMTGLADLQASGADRNPDTETETAAPTAEDLDTVCGQFAAMSQMPGFDRSMLQKQLGLKEDTICFDLNAACTGFVYALHTAECLLNASPRKFGLVVGAEALSKVVDWTDRGTCILFGDGAAAAVVECREGWPSIGAVLGSRGDDVLLRLPGLGRGEPNVLSMEGTQVFKFAVETVPACMDATLKKAGLTPADIDFFVFHQANARIIDLAVRKYRIPPEKYYKNIDRYGNTAAASVPLVLSELVEQGRVGPGSRLLLTAFGGGLTWGGCLIEIGGIRK